MEKLKNRWWGYACRMVLDYPKLEKVAELAHGDLRDRDAVAKAIEITRQHPQGEERLALIKRVYWGRARCTIRNAAIYSYISEITAYRWHGDFIRLVGKCWGFDVK